MTRGGPDSLEDYRRLRRSYRLAAPELFNFGHDVVDRWAADRPDAPALWWVGPDAGERRLTFRDVADRSARVANALRAAGLERGDR
ncbi:MAG TPA: AMP-binding protein, partial [Longimicrobiales bacterium]|nr:AMP-binding protein [Longimicrobiales bacterium]